MNKHLSTLLPLLYGCAVIPTAERFGTPPHRLALAVPEPRQLLSVNGLQVAVHDTDPSALKPAIVCLHAIAHGGSDFAAVVQFFSPRYRLVLVDWPGHGASSPDTLPASAERYEAVLSAVMEQLALHQVVLLGNSIGGAAATRYAAAHPERVRALVLSNPGGFDEGGVLARLFIGHLQSRFQWGMKGQARFQPWFQDYYNRILVTAAGAEQKQKIVRSGFEMAAILFQAWDSFAQPTAYLGPLVPTLTMPMFVA